MAYNDLLTCDNAEHGFLRGLVEPKGIHGFNHL